MHKLTIMIGAAAVAVGANADTVNIGGVVWSYTDRDDTAKTVTLGLGGNGNTAMPTSTAIDAASIPWVMTINSEQYAVTKVNSYAFYQCTSLTGTLAIPSFSEKYIFEMLGKGVKVAKKIVDAFENEAARRKRVAEEEARRIEAQRQREMEEKERRLREQRIREEAERRAAALAAEKAFYEDIVGRGNAVVDHRLAHDFIDELTKRWQAEGALTKGRQEWLEKANMILEKMDPFKVNA